MKRAGHLFEQVCSWKNLWQAASKARAGKRHRPDVALFEFNREFELLQLCDQLSTDRYRPGRYFSFQISDPKQRLISCAPYRDRVVHHAVCQVMEPIWERIFINDSYACRVGRGSLAAMKRAHDFCRRFPYVLQCDIQRFFPSIDHEILQSVLAKKLKDPRLLNLLRTIIGHRFPGQTAGTYFPGDNLFSVVERSCGLPIGNQTSQFFGNVMLNPLDHFVKEELQCQGYVRYADDFLIFGHDAPSLSEIRQRVNNFLQSYRLRIHAHKSTVFPVRGGIPFLGFRLFPGRIHLQRKHVLKLRRRLRQMRRAYSHGALQLPEIKASLQSWWGFAMHADCRVLVESIMADHPFLRVSDDQAGQSES